ncbi:E3 ubiquitin-protein ligase DCST1 isoform X2 [Crotalus tigris]|uniref:E3 ubiquitin-protein ligase DCST1 isoform X2 n=1 Tax=Crotalus tigris TaxID=88082 RepID=UPI00192F8E78|nr:E3 ubiquitin-protein ligase DCST1 isoform X2 [Crotalus tigris]
MGGKYQKLKGQKRKHFKSPNTTLKHFLGFFLPKSFVHFLWSQPDEFRPTKFFLGAGLGILFALSLAKILIFPMTIREHTKVELLGCMTGVAAVGWGTSPQFRCASLLVIPKFLGKEGRLYILTYMLAAVYDGPVANIRHNLGEVVRSISCTVELQIENAKKAWKISLAPMRKILKDMVRSGKTLRTESQEVSRSFTELNKQVASRAGTESRLVREAEGSASTQEVYEAKTRMRCQRIIQQAVRRCRAWFQTKHRSCMQTIAVPLVNHLLCLPMKFSFLCYLAKVMNTWCQDKIPVEGNFGQTYDRVNDSVENLNQDFTASVVIQEERQEMLVGANLSSHKHLVDDVNEQVYQSSKQLGTAVTMLRVLLSCMFILVFASAYSYTNKYNEDIRFDNLYISRYFRQIDARRRKQKKRTLLPLRRAEESRVIEPLRLAFQPAETKSVMLELLGCLPPLVFLLMACALDSLLYTIFSTIRNHSFIQYSFRSEKRPSTSTPPGWIRTRVRKGGRQPPLGSQGWRGNPDGPSPSEHHRGPEHVLRNGDGDQQPAVRRNELSTSTMKCFVGVWLSSLCNASASFCKRGGAREWKPLLNRIGRCCPFLKRILLRRCILCNRPESHHSLMCSNPECETVYCQICWKDMGKTCFACHPEDLVSEDESSEGETGYAD